MGILVGTDCESLPFRIGSYKEYSPNCRWEIIVRHAVILTFHVNRLGPLSHWIFAPSGSSCIGTQPICLSHASVSNVKLPSSRGNDGTGVVIRFCCSIALQYI